MGRWVPDRRPGKTTAAVLPGPAGGTLVAMRAVVYDAFTAPPAVRTVPDPSPGPEAAVLRVRATGLCRSDWHGWRGHDPDITPPHVPGHEFAGDLVALGARVTGWRIGERVTAPFVCACGACPECLAGDGQVCRAQSQPGFTHWGSFAEYVTVEHAAVNLVRLPDAVEHPVAAALGCRYATAFRAVVDQGRVTAGEWLAVYGCGGVGLSAVQIAVAAGARVVAVDVNPHALELARSCGAELCHDARGADGPQDVAAAVRDLTGGGTHAALDALGSPDTCLAALHGLRRRGRHVQVGLLPAAAGRPALPMDRVVAHELEIRGSHGAPAHRYPALLALITAGRLDPARLVTGELTLDEAPAALATMDSGAPAGIRVIRP
jgi:D-arabinose 1-dehydrogenase-like Zn-dependent alcohol dehydrogenase